MANLGTLTLDLIAKIGLFTAPLDKAGREVRKFRDHTAKMNADAAKSFEQLNNSMKTVALGATVFLAQKALELGRAFISMSADTAKATTELLDMAEATGVTVQAMDRFINMARLQHIEASQITAVIQHLSKAMEEAKDPTSDQAKIFKVLSDATGRNILEMKDMTQILRAVSDGFSKFEGGTARSAAASELLGRSGQKLLSFFSKSEEDLAALSAEAEKFGGVLSDLEANKLKKVDQAFERLGLSWQSLKRAMADTSASFVDDIALMMKGIGDLVAFEDRFVAHMKKEVGGGVQFGRGPLDFNVDHFERVEDFMAKMDAWLPRKIEQSEKLKANAKLEFPTIKELPKIDTEEDKRIAALKKESLALEKQMRTAIEIHADEMARLNLLIKDGGLDLVTYSRAQKAANDALAAAIGLDAAREKVNPLGLVPLPDELFFTIKETAEVTKDLGDSTNFAADALKTLQEWEEEGIELKKSFRTATQEYADEVEHLTDLLYGGAIGQETFNKAVKAAGEKGFESAPVFDESGNLDPMGKLNEEAKELEDWYKKQIDLVNEFRAKKLGTVEEWNAKESAINQTHQDELEKIEMARMKMMLSSASDAFGNMAEITASFAGKESAAYKTMFAISKAFALAKAAVDMGLAIANAGANVPFPANFAAMAAAGAAMAAVIASIAAVGMAHEGMDSIPKSGSWILEKGERVTTEKTSKRLDRTLDRIQQDQRMGGSSLNVIVNEAPGTSAQVSKRADGGLDVNIALIEERLLERMNRGSGLAGAFDRRYGRKY